MRNYAALGTWWQLRARVIDGSRQLKAVDDSLLNSRLDYATIDAKAKVGESATVFTELSTIRRVSGTSRGASADGSTRARWTWASW